MRVALVSWEMDDAIAAALAEMGLEVVAFTRWVEGQPLRQGRGGWLKELCTVRPAGDRWAEARSFAESVRARSSTVPDWT